MKRVAAFAAALASCLLPGCATVPDNASYLYGDRYNRARLHTYPTRVTHVDGRSTMFNENPVPIEPGMHVITLQAAPVPGFRQPEARELKLMVEPCKRYYLVAERDYGLEKDWRPVVDYVQPDRTNCTG